MPGTRSPHVPLVVLLAIVATTPAMRMLARLQLHNRSSLKLALGLTTTMIALAALAFV